MWLRPKQEQANELAQIISRLARDYGTPPFPPHVTLLPVIAARSDTIRRVCKKIADTMREFEIPLQGIDYTETYHRNFFILAAPVPALTDLYERTKKVLACKTDEHFMPHLSLLYGSLDLKTKCGLKEEIEGTYPATLHCQGIDLYDIGGDVADWSCIGSYEFARTRR